MSLLGLHKKLNCKYSLWSIIQASIMCDYIVMYCLKKRNKYKSFKYQHVEDEVSTDDNLENEV